MDSLLPSDPSSIDGNVVGVISAVVSNADNVGIAIPLKQLCVKILNCSQDDW